MRFHITIELPSLANLRVTWRQMASLKKQQKAITKVCMGMCLIETRLPTPPLIVTLTRIGPRRLDDDNLASSCKYVRDQIADIVGMDDGSDQYSWRYEQRIGKYGVDVEILSR